MKELLPSFYNFLCVVFATRKKFNSKSLKKDPQKILFLFLKIKIKKLVSLYSVKKKLETWTDGKTSSKLRRLVRHSLCQVMQLLQNKQGCNTCVVFLQLQ